MIRHPRPALVAAFVALVLAGTAAAQVPPPPDSVPTLEAVTVSGVQPGPGLWRATRGDHVVLILGTLSPIPGNITWKTDEVDDAVAHAGALILPPHVEVKPNVGFFGRLALLPSLIGVRNSPDGKTLQETVPADVYGRWQAVKAKYIGDDNKVERYRPIFAAIDLYKQAVKKSGLRKSGYITDAVVEMAKKHNVPQVPVEYTLLVDDPRSVVKEFKRSTLDDLSCFTQSVDNIEPQLAAMRERANAWATGDVGELRDERRAKQLSTCLDAVTEGGLAQRIGLTDVPAQVRTRWLAAVDTQVAAHDQVVAIVPLDDLIGPKGYLSALEARGFKVESPDDGDAPDKTAGGTP
ncbi:TraB/GumN family protein [Bacillus sp. NP157]|nr:TraB/GumN family protein [Bacillus sp. NP157]